MQGSVNVDFAELLGSLSELDNVLSMDTVPPAPVYHARPVITTVLGRNPVTTGAGSMPMPSLPSGSGSHSIPYMQMSGPAWAGSLPFDLARLSSNNSMQQQQQQHVPMPAAVAQPAAATAAAAAAAGSISNQGLPDPFMHAAIKHEPVTTGLVSSNKRGRQNAGPSGGVKEQISDLEQQLARKVNELNLLQQQNSRLKAKGRMLEMVIKARDEQVERLKRLRAHMQALAPAALDGPPSKLTPAASSLSGVSSSPARAMSAASAGPDHTSSISDRGLPPAVPAVSDDATAGGVEQRRAGSFRRGSVDGPSGSAGSGGADTSPLVELEEGFDLAALAAFKDMSIEELMGRYKLVIEQLTAELVKPNQGRLTELMGNLRDFTRNMTLLSDKPQLLVSRDVSSLPDSGSLTHSAPSASGAVNYDRSGSFKSQTSTSSGPLSAGGECGPPSSGPSSLIITPSVVPADANALVAASMLPALSSGGTSMQVSTSVSHAGWEPPSRENSAKQPAEAEPAMLGPPGEMQQQQEQLWHAVAASLNLTPQQKADVLALQELHTSWVTKVVAERQRLNNMLSELLNVNKYGTVYHETLAGGMTEAQVLGRMQRNVHAEHALLGLVGEVFIFHILTLEQSARMLIQSWPMIPDTVAVLHHIHVAHDD